MKKRNIFILVFLILIISITPIFAKSSYKLSINENIYEEKEILDLNGIIYLPVRDVLERLNYIVTWDHSSKSVAAKNEDEVLSFSIDQNEVDSNGNKYNLKAKNILKGENTYSPVELFGKYTETIGSFNDKKKEFAFRNKKESDVIKSNDADEISNKIDDYLLKNVKNKNFHGSVLVAKEDKILINKGYSFVFTEKDNIVASVAISFDGENTYNYIYEGKWLSNEKYCVIHRLVVDSKLKGNGISSKIIKKIEEICLENNIHSIKIDTHKENLSMQKLLKKNNFSYCGIIYLESKAPRVAFEKLF